MLIGAMIILKLKLRLSKLLQLPHLVFWFLIVTLFGLTPSSSLYLSILSFILILAFSLYHSVKESLIAVTLLLSLFLI